MRSSTISAGMLAGLLALCATAQETEISYFKNDKSARMRCGQACDGFLLAWEKATTINVRPGSEGGPKEGILTQERIHCLLDDFQIRQAENMRDESILDNELAFALLVLGPEAMDMVAAEYHRLTGMTQHGVGSWLLSGGHPVAVAQMIENRRRRFEETHGTNETPSLGFAVTVSPMIAEGTCAAPVCSARVNESVKLIADNLDLVEQELRGIERWAQRTGNSHGIKVTNESLDMVQLVSRTSGVGSSATRSKYAIDGMCGLNLVRNLCRAAGMRAG